MSILYTQEDYQKFIDEADAKIAELQNSIQPLSDKLKHLQQQRLELLEKIPSMSASEIVELSSSFETIEAAKKLINEQMKPVLETINLWQQQKFHSINRKTKKDFNDKVSSATKD